MARRFSALAVIGLGTTGPALAVSPHPPATG